jgi:hypothetical protein
LITYSDQVETVRNEQLESVHALPGILGELDSVCPIDPSHHLAELGDVRPSDKEMLVEQEWVFPIEVILEVCLRCEALCERYPGE